MSEERNGTEIDVDIDRWWGVFIGEVCFALFPDRHHARDWCRGKLGERHMAVLEIRRKDNPDKSE